MTPYYADDWLTVYHGDCRAVMAEMQPESVHCVVTSPPYWGLRDYGDPGQLGLEPTPEAYVANLVAVFREVRRVLRKDGTVWLNLGDSAAVNGGARSYGSTDGAVGRGDAPGEARRAPSGLKPKDLVGIPWRVAFALQADGWYLRSDIIWSKPNPMPESVTDRPTKSHEYLFLLAKSARYYFDADAVREGASQPIGEERASGNATWKAQEQGGARTHTGRTSILGSNQGSAFRNIRSVWTVATAPYPGAHFATFPPKLIEPCIKAGTSERGVCPECGAPWEREVEATRLMPSAPSGNRELRRWADDQAAVGQVGGRRTTATTGWRPSCTHGGWFPDDGQVAHNYIFLPKPVPATVLDPFAGSGTTGMVAQSLSRRAVLIDLSLDYLGQLMDRNADIPLGLGA